MANEKALGTESVVSKEDFYARISNQPLVGRMTEPEREDYYKFCCEIVNKYFTNHIKFENGYEIRPYHDKTEELKKRINDYIDNSQLKTEKDEFVEFICDTLFAICQQFTSESFSNSYKNGIAILKNICK